MREAVFSPEFVRIIDAGDNARAHLRAGEDET